MGDHKIKLLWVNCYCSPDTFSCLFNTLNHKPEVSIQHYMDLLYNGFDKQGVSIDTVCERQLTLDDRRGYWKGFKESGVHNDTIKYIPFLNIPILSQVFRFVYNLFYFAGRFVFSEKPDVMMCDVMRFYTSYPAYLMARLFKVKVIGYVADIPQMYHHQTSKKQSIIKQWIKRIYSRASQNYDGYVLLSNYMNEYVNPKRKPYIIVEGLVGTRESINELCSKAEKYNDNKTVIMYSGGLYEKYGVKYLIDAVANNSDTNIILWLLGKGELEGYIKELNCDRIFFYGYQPHDVTVKKQQEADFLINPRPSDEEFTKYSFPSKIMEYMVSGTPVISTRIKSIPQEYFKYIIPIEEESVDGIREVLRSAAATSNKDRCMRGNASKEFVLTEKNCVRQAERIITWLKDYKVI